jgi:GDPmannose 4,6-dehydratase
LRPAFARAGLPLTWEGEGVSERGVTPTGACSGRGRPAYFRPTEVDVLCGDPTKARERLGWQPRVTFRELVDIMVDADMDLVRREVTLKNAGFVGTGGDA